MINILYYYHCNNNFIDTVGNDYFFGNRCGVETKPFCVCCLYFFVKFIHSKIFYYLCINININNN